jgi:hypothetical protein
MISDLKRILDFIVTGRSIFTNHQKPESPSPTNKRALHTSLPE